MFGRILKFAGYQAVTQAVSALTILLLSLLLAPEALASYGLALTIASLISAVVTLRIEQAVLASDEVDALPLALASALVATALGGGLLILSSITASQNLAIFVGVISGLSLALVGVIQQALIRAGDSAKAGRAAATRALLIAIFVIGGATVGEYELHGLALSSIIVFLISYVQLWSLGARIRDRDHFKEVIVKYKDIWRPYFVESLFSTTSLNLPYLALFTFSVPAIAAAFLLADRLVRMPITFMSSAVRSHLVHEFRELKAKGKNKEALASTARWSVRMGFGGGVLVLIIGVVTFAVGKAWEEALWADAGVMAAVLSIWAGSVMSNAASRAALTVHRKNYSMMSYQALEMIGRASLIAICFPLAERMPLLFLLVVFMPGVCMNVFLGRLARSEWRSSSSQNHA